MEDARVKMMKDYAFPPASSSDQVAFSYHENVYDIGGTQIVGGYTVTVDSRFRNGPYYVVKLTSQGHVGAQNTPQATYSLMAEVDVSSIDRSQMGTTVLNPNSHNVLRWKAGTSQ